MAQAIYRQFPKFDKFYGATLVTHWLPLKLPPYRSQMPREMPRWAYKISDPISGSKNLRPRGKCEGRGANENFLASPQAALMSCRAIDKTDKGRQRFILRDIRAERHRKLTARQPDSTTARTGNKKKTKICGKAENEENVFCVRSCILKLFNHN